MLAVVSAVMGSIGFGYNTGVINAPEHVRAKFTYLTLNSYSGVCILVFI